MAENHQKSQKSHHMMTQTREKVKVVGLKLISKVLTFKKTAPVVYGPLKSGILTENLYSNGKIPRS